MAIQQHLRRCLVLTHLDPAAAWLIVIGVVAAVGAWIRDKRAKSPKRGRQ